MYCINILIMGNSCGVYDNRKQFYRKWAGRERPSAPLQQPPALQPKQTSPESSDRGGEQPRVAPAGWGWVRGLVPGQRCLMRPPPLPIGCVLSPWPVPVGWVARHQPHPQPHLQAQPSSSAPCSIRAIR